MKHYFHSLWINTQVPKDTEVSEATSSVYKTILKLSSHYLASHRGNAHKVEFFRAAVAVCEWAREPISRVAAHQLTYQQNVGRTKLCTTISKEG